MRRFKSGWALFEEQRAGLHERSECPRRAQKRRYGSVGNRTTIGTQNPECCGFDSHLSHCEERPGSSNSRAAGCQPEGCGCESRAGRWYGSVVSTAACPGPNGKVRVQILADLLITSRYASGAHLLLISVRRVVRWRTATRGRSCQARP